MQCLGHVSLNLDRDEPLQEGGGVRILFLQFFFMFFYFYNGGYVFVVENKHFSDLKKSGGNMTM